MLVETVVSEDEEEVIKDNKDLEMEMNRDDVEGGLKSPPEKNGMKFYKPCKKRL